VPRPCEFDEGEALDRAIVAFWKGGYEGTRLETLLEAMGVGRQSVYNKFGDKRALFMKCLHRYHERSRENLRQHFAPGRSAAEAFASLFESVVVKDDGEKRMGCFMVNSAMELVRTDVEVADLVARNQRALEDVFVTALEEGKKRGELPHLDDPRRVGRFLIGAFFGLLVLAKSDPRSPALADMAGVALGVLAR
jgi:TetR/AcrR family transcriptional regulator, transcriptional repressor for nem operon